MSDMIKRIDFADIELTGQHLHRSFLNHAIGGGDDLADRFGVRVHRDGQPVTLTGSCAGYFVRNTTGETVVISSGTISGNEAYVTLPEACYAVEGSFSLAIKVSSNENEVVTLRIVDGVVSRTNTSELVDPGDIMPTVEELLEDIAAAVASVPADYSSLLAEIAPTYSSSATYAVGDYAWYDGDLKRCIVPITTAEEYTAAHWVSVVIGKEVSDLKSAMTDITGNEIISVTTKKYIATNGETADISSPTGGNAYGYAIVDCSPGDVFTVSGRGGDAPRLYAFLGAETNGSRPVLVKATKSELAENKFITAPANAEKLVLNVTLASGYLLMKGKRIKQAWNAIDGTITDDLNDIREGTINLWKNHDVTFTESEDFDCVIPAGTYTLTVTGITTESTQTTARVEFFDADGNRINTTQENISTPASVSYYAMAVTGRQDMPSGGGSFAVFTNTTQIARVRLYSSNTQSNSVGKTATWTGLQIESGYKTSVTYVKPYTAKDDVARKALELFSLNGKKVVCFGDSIIGNYTAPTDIPSFIATATGAECINVGFGGTRLTDNSAYGNKGYFSFCKLVEAVTAGSFTAQETALSNMEDPDGLYRANLTKLEGIDFSTVDIVTFEQCTNDYYGDIYVTREGVSGNLIFDNAMRYCIDALLTAYPNLRIVVIGPIYRWFSSSSDSNNYTNSRGFTLIDFKNKMQEIAQEFNLPFIDDYYLGINKYTHAKFLSDGTHPTEDGRELIASNIAKHLF